ncbi:MAG: alpha/beta hydrolase, partial [Actinomycetota bacterium]
MHRGEVEYARSGEHHIAYREYRGDTDGGHDIVMVNGGNWPMDALPEDPVGLRLLEGLAELGRLVMFDRRGIALSDPLTDWDRPLRVQWADDLAAVISAAGCEQPTVFGWGTGAVARTCSTTHPDLIGRLVLLNPSTEPTDADQGWVAQFVEELARMMDGENAGDPAAPGRAGDPAYRA